MKKIIKNYIENYFNSYWIPLFSYIALSVFNTIMMMTFISNSNYMLYSNYYGYVIELFALGIFAAAIWNLYRKRWLKAIVNVLFILLPMLFMYSMFGA